MYNSGTIDPDLETRKIFRILLGILLVGIPFLELFQELIFGGFFFLTFLNSTLPNLEPSTVPVPCPCPCLSIKCSLDATIIMQALDLPLDQIIAAKQKAQKKPPSKVRAAAATSRPKVVKATAASSKKAGGKASSVKMTNVRPVLSQSQTSRSNPSTSRSNPITSRSASSASILSRLGNGGGGNVEGGTTVTISNLHAEILPSDVSELCATIGSVKKLDMHFDARGTSTGVVDVVFHQRSVALKCVEKFHDVPLDGRKMAVRLAEEVTRGGGGGHAGGGNGGGGAKAIVFGTALHGGGGNGGGGGFGRGNGGGSISSSAGRRVVAVGGGGGGGGGARGGQKVAVARFVKSNGGGGGGSGRGGGGGSGRGGGGGGGGGGRAKGNKGGASNVDVDAAFDSYLSSR